MSEVKTEGDELLLDQPEALGFGQQTPVALGVNLAPVAFELQLTLQHQHLPCNPFNPKKIQNKYIIIYLFSYL